MLGAMRSPLLSFVLMLVAAGCSSREPPSPLPSTHSAATGEPATKAPQRPSPSPAAETVSNAIWEGTSDQYRVRWSPVDLTVSRLDDPSQQVFSVKAMLRARFDDDIAKLRAEGNMDGPDAPDGACEQDSRVKLLSLVGPFLSYREDWSLSCPSMAHAFEQVFVRTYDLGAKRFSTLDEVFTEQELFAALSSDRLVRTTLDASHSKASTLRELLAHLSQHPSLPIDPLCFEYPGDLLGRFAFHSVIGDRVAVRIGLPGGGFCRTNLTLMDLELRTPPKLRDALQAAARAEGGTLFAALEREARELETNVTFKVPMR